MTLRTEKIQGENRNNKGNDDKGYMTEINDQRKEVKESNNQDALKKSFHEREAEGKEETRNSRKQKNDDKDDKRKETRRKHEQEWKEKKVIVSLSRVSLQLKRIHFIILWITRRLPQTKALQTRKT